MSKAVRFFTTAGIYMIGNVLSRLIGFFLLPLYTGALLPDQFGKFDLVATVVTLTVPVVFFQIWDGMFRFMFEKKEADDKYAVITNSYLVWMTGFLIYSLLYTALSSMLRLEHTLLIFLYGASIAAQYQYVFIARAFLRNRLFVLSGLVNSALGAVMAVVLIRGFGMGIEALYTAPITGSLIQIIIIEMVLHPIKHLRLHHIKINELTGLIRFSLPLCAATVLYWLLNGYTKLVVARQLGTYANGLYAVANRFCSVMTFIITVFQYAWYETAYLMAKDIDRTDKFVKSIEYIYKMAVLGSSVFILLTRLVFPYFIDPAYHDALAIVPLSLAGVAANAFASFIDTIFMAEKQTKWITGTTITGAVVNMTALWILTPVWGLWGAAAALCLAFLILVVFRLYILGRKFSIAISLSKSVYLIFLAAAIYIFYTVDGALWLALAATALTGSMLFCLRDILISLWRGITAKRPGSPEKFPREVHYDLEADQVIHYEKS